VAETVALINEAGDRAIGVAADITDHQAVDSLVAETERQLGAVGLLVNGVGQVQPIGPLWTVDPDEWRQCFDSNLHGTFLCTRAVLPGMITRGGGCIINVISSAGLRAIPYGAAYVTAKTAVLRLTECIAAEAGVHGVRAFAVHPGVVRTEMLRYLADSAEGQRWTSWARGAWEQSARPATDAAQLSVALASGVADALSGRYVEVGDNLTTLVQNADDLQKQDRRLLHLHR
jgi:NAD(P)-dependent dehydrogenase (short-subunit alcohol dehydrogenase family)